MKLRTIAEAEAVVQNAGKAMGDLIKFIYELGPQAQERGALDQFLTKPSARGWEQTKWVVDSAMSTALKLRDPEIQNRARAWADLKRLTSPVVAASVYAVDPAAARGTPLQKLAMTRPNQEKLMSSLGPQGFVSALSNMGNVPASKAKETLKKQATNAKADVAAVKHDLPGTRIVKKF